MKPANIKVKTCLERAGIKVEIRILPSAVRTAQLAADALGCEVGQIANSLIFRDQVNHQAVLVMCAGDRRYLARYRAGLKLSSFEFFPAAV